MSSKAYTKSLMKSAITAKKKYYNSPLSQKADQPRKPDFQRLPLIITPEVKKMNLDRRKPTKKYSTPPNTNSPAYNPAKG